MYKKSVAIISNSQIPHSSNLGLGTYSGIRDNLRMNLTMGVRCIEDGACLSGSILLSGLGGGGGGGGG